MDDALVTAAPQTRTVCLLDADEEFAAAVPPEDHPLAMRSLTLREHVVPAGGDVRCDDEEAFALVVVAGALWREVAVGEGAAPHLLDRGSVVLRAPRSSEFVGAAPRTVALGMARLAVLDRRFLLSATRWPALATVLHQRVADQERDLGIQVAIAHLPRVEERVELLLWHLAERWGRVHSDGIRLPLRLTHASLGRFVGARRPTVSLAVAQLRDRGVLGRGPDGSWVLHGEPPGSQADGLSDKLPPERLPEVF